MKIISQKSEVFSGLFETVGYNCGCKKGVAHHG
nr:MAG TPA: hypothetical protein [Caudoviricetes sp.]